MTTYTMYVAWWGAILATVVFIWDIIKWRMAGPKLRVSVQFGMKTFNMPEFEGNTVMSVRVANYGDRTTTITNVTYRYFSDFSSWVWRRPDQLAVIPMRGIPHELKAGTEWTGIWLYDEEVIRWANDGLLYVALYHSHSERPIYIRAVISGSLDVPKQSVEPQFIPMSEASKRVCEALPADNPWVVSAGNLGHTLGIPRSEGVLIYLAGALKDCGVTPFGKKVPSMIRQVIPTEEFNRGTFSHSGNGFKYQHVDDVVWTDIEVKVSEVKLAIDHMRSGITYKELTA